MKSAYELALERLAADGIEPPNEKALSAEDREQIAELRRRAEAKVAELEILHHDKEKALSGTERGEEEEAFRREKLRIEQDRDRKIEVLRRSS